MKAVILGHFVLDEIHPLAGDPIVGPGGIAFCLGGFHAAADDDDDLLAVLPVGEDGIEAFRAFCAPLHRIRTDAVDVVPAPTTRVRLYHESMSHYHTRLVAALPPISWEAVEPHLSNADLVYLNMMTGEDITLDTARAIRRTCSGLFYLDVHMIAYRTEVRGDRHVHPSHTASEWLELADVLQCNESELSALLLPGEAPDAGMRRLVTQGRTRRLVLTRGDQGAVMVTHTGIESVPVVPAPRVVDPTGCGDVFGSVLAHGLASGLHASRAAARAAHAAAQVVALPGSHGIDRLRALLKKEDACAF